MERTIVLLLLLRLLFLICRFALSLFADSKYELASVQNGGFLKIHQVDSTQDAGTYACIVLNRAGEEGRREMELSVNSMWRKQCKFRTSILFDFQFSLFTSVRLCFISVPMRLLFCLKVHRSSNHLHFPKIYKKADEHKSLVLFHRATCRWHLAGKRTINRFHWVYRWVHLNHSVKLNVNKNKRANSNWFCESKTNWMAFSLCLSVVQMVRLTWRMTNFLRCSCSKILRPNTVATTHASHWIQQPK